ncbi:MAG: D-alanine--D-alanine ligase [Pseudomonadota bacterium]
MRAPSEFGRVCVLMGGMAAEREISLKSGIAVLDALKSVGIDAEGLDWGEGFELFELQRFDRIFIAVHGRGGEDGRLQGALDMLRLPYTGSGFAASALAMDKIRAKQVWQSCDIPTPHFAVARSDREPDSRLLKSLGLPLMVKPNREGSSLGATRVEDRSELPAAIETALGFDTDVLIEPWISGVEYTLGVVGRRALPLIKLETPRDFYDYEAKYFSNTTRYICPAGLSEDRERALAKISMDAFDALGSSCRSLKEKRAECWK